LRTSSSRKPAGISACRRPLR